MSERINRKFLDEITKRLDIVSAAGRSTVEQIMINAPQTFNFDELYAYVQQNYIPVVQACADDAAAVGASAYDAYREIETGEALGAEPYTAFDEYGTERAARAFVHDACEAQDMAMLVDYLGRRLDGEVIRSYSKTQTSNGAKDSMKPRFARVPSGDNPCAFCRALAGHGFYYSSKEAAGDEGGNFNRYHDYCRCQVVPEFSRVAKRLEVQGYDPDFYVKEWRESGQKFGQNRQHKKMTPTGRPSAAMPKIEKPLLTDTPQAAVLPEKVFSGAWNQKEDMNTFLKTMFKDDEYVGTCSEFFTTKDGRRAPTRGLFQRKSKQIENVLDNTNNVAAAVGRYKRADGAYVRVNPLDGRGVSDANVSAFRYTLLECDTLPLDQQYGFVKALNLPTQAIVTSGKKSLHTVVKIDAANLEEYKERVALLHAECKAAGFDIDTSTKNPSRYMRIPGVVRGDGRQALVSTNEGTGSWSEWRKWCENRRANG